MPQSEVTTHKLTDIVAVASGGSHLLALSRSGAVFGWGTDDQGQASVPARLREVRAIAAGATHSLALQSDGTVVAWGSNLNGQVDVPDGLRDVVAIDAGGETSFALRSDGSALYWGMYASGGARTMAVPGFRIVSIGVGDSHLSAVFDDGEMGGQFLDLSAEYSPVAPPMPLPFLTQVSVGSGFLLGLAQDGSVVAWGRNDFGQSTPPPSLAGVMQVSAGGGVALALTTDRSVVGWGTAQVPAGLTEIASIAAGAQSIALKTDGTVVTWSNGSQ